jgi:hypothetical protein
MPHNSHRPSKMERLTGPVFGEVTFDSIPKTFFLCSCDSFENLPAAVQPPADKFGLLILADASQVSTDDIFRAAEKLIVKGLVYLSVWGKDCERVHDLFDDAELAPSLDNPGSTPSRTLMTTWHTKDSIEEVFFFFVNSAWPDESCCERCEHWIIAVVGNPNWEATVRREIPKLVYSKIQVDIKKGE